MSKNVIIYGGGSYELAKNTYFQILRGLESMNISFISNDGSLRIETAHCNICVAWNRNVSDVTIGNRYDAVFGFPYDIFRAFIHKRTYTDTICDLSKETSVISLCNYIRGVEKGVMR